MIKFYQSYKNFFHLIRPSFVSWRCMLERTSGVLTPEVVFLETKIISYPLRILSLICAKAARIILRARFLWTALPVFLLVVMPNLCVLKRFLTAYVTSTGEALKDPRLYALRKSLFLFITYFLSINKKILQIIKIKTTEMVFSWFV